ncbi:membrane or secreted protein, partial [Pseudoxanthomonas sp. SGD-10]
MLRTSLIFLFIFVRYIAEAQINKGIYVDDAGKIRWEGSNKEAYFFGVNYSSPFVFGYRHIKAKGVDLEDAIKQDVYHLARLGVNAYRIHVFDTEITDSLGNIKENEHLRLFDFLIAELKKRNIKILLTPIAYWGNGYPERDIPTGSFSFKYGKRQALVNKEAWKAQENYLTQFFQRKNRYTGKTYQEDVDILASEINNEPHHSGAQELTTDYINLMVTAIRNTGWTKPIFYNISESPKYAEAVVKSNVQGHTFQWYPAGLVAGRTQKGNFLPHVSKYNIPFDSIPGFNKRAKIVYEFDGADIADTYVYPAMAKSFREAGFQWATMFAYDPLAIADVNTEYQTHYLNLAFTPSKAISFMIANKYFTEGFQPILSYEQNLSLL